MKVGDTFYFVDVVLGKISKHKVKDIVPPCTQGKSEYITFSSLPHKFHPSYFRCINPVPENYFFSNVKTPSKKCYLVFTNKKLALEALVNYVLLTNIDEEKRTALELIELYNKKIQNVQDLEKKIEEGKKELKALK